MQAEELDTKKFATQFTAFIDSMNREASQVEEAPVFVEILTKHFEISPTQLPVVMELFGGYDHVNFQLALENVIAENRYEQTTVGFRGEHYFERASFAGLLNSRASYSQGPVIYKNFELPSGESKAGIQDGLVLLGGSNAPVLAILVTGPARYEFQLKIEVMGLDQSSAQKLLHRIREEMITHNAYRGKVISVGTVDRQISIATHQLPQITRDNIILQEGVLRRIEHLTISFAKRTKQLKAANRHIKRGLLLHGPPGTGKTLTAMYLANAMEGRTVVLMTGQEMGLLGSTISLSRALSPALVILEDVDLIAEERSQQQGCSLPLLFELLNLMDGLASDVDIIFLLTTNRPEILEPALAARPGRIDQAIEIPLPDSECRTRLFDLYGEGLNLKVENLPGFVQRTEGASAAFIKELFRRAALFGDDDGDTISITDKNMEDALQEILSRGGQLTQSLLGFKE